MKNCSNVHDKARQRFCLTAEGERGPLHRTKHKAKIDKEMFLSAMACPRYDKNRMCMFDGKIIIL